MKDHAQTTVDKLVSDPFEKLKTEHNSKLRV